MKHWEKAVGIQESLLCFREEASLYYYLQAIFIVWKLDEIVYYIYAETFLMIANALSNKKNTQLLPIKFYVKYEQLSGSIIVIAIWGK